MTSPNASPNTNPGGPNQTPAPGSPPLNQAFDSSQFTSTTNPIGTFLADGINPAVQPPALKTFVYSPEVKVIIGHEPFQFDVSSDIVRCILTRPENSAASFFMTLHNKDLRYTPNDKPRFSRMDRIVVYMKKTSWLQVFSGYIDKVPYRQLYPGTVDIKATCTLKRLMHTWFNPDLPASNRLLNQRVGDFLNETDSGLGSLLGRVLHDAGGWSYENIHIQNFPTGFFAFMQAMVTLSNQENAPNQLTVEQMILGQDTSPGPGAYAGSNPNAGTPGPSTPGVGGIPGASAGVAGSLTMFYVSQIVAACDEKGLGPQVSDNNMSASMAQAGTIGENSSNPSQQKAWSQVQQANLNAQQANRNSDGAILGVAAAMVLTGGGAEIRNLYNAAVPGSDQFANDGPSLTGTGVGILQEPNGSEWGDVSQRMNPKQAAGMFFANIAALGEQWRNMDPGDAIAQALRSSSPVAFAAAIPLATKVVQAYRTALAGTPSTVVTGTGPTLSTGMSSTGAASAGLGGAPGLNPNLVTGASSTSPAPVASLGAVNPLRSGKPQPDSEGAINWAMTQLGKPYVWGATGPAGYDCSGLVSQAFKAIGIDTGRTTEAIATHVPRVPNSSVQRGDLVEPSSEHVVLWCGDGTIIEAQQTGVPVHRIPNPYPPASWYGVFRACLNGGPDPTAPFNPPATMGPGNPPGALDQQAGALGVGSGGVSEPTARNLFGYIFTGEFTADLAQAFPGRHAFVEGQPLIQIVQAVASAGLRSWSSAPNGDFMAWYPDWWGLDGKPAVLRLEDIELKDVHLDFSDDALTTHVYVNGDWSKLGQPDDINGWLTSAGIMTVEDPDTWLYQRLIDVAPSDEDTLTGDALMRRYGVRPLKETFAMAGSTELEFLLACKIFMEKWAQQYETEISMTFMPELFPGMRVELSGKNLQVYVSSVTHVCDYEQGFSTTATIMAPSTPMAKKLMSEAKSPGPATTSSQAQLGLFGKVVNFTP